MTPTPTTATQPIIHLPKKRKNYNEKQIIHDYTDKNMKIQTILDTHNISYNRFNQILKNNGIPKRKGRSRKRYKPQQIIQEYTKTDINIYKLASNYNISYVMVYRVLKQHGVPTRRDPNRYKNDMRRLSPLIDNILQDYYDDKFIMKSLYRKYNTTEYVFLKIIKEYRTEHSFRRSKGYKIHRIIEDDNGNCIVEYYHHYLVFAKTSVNMQPYIHDVEDRDPRCIYTSVII
jgi:hypothetical protein